MQISRNCEWNVATVSSYPNDWCSFYQDDDKISFRIKHLAVSASNLE